MTRGDRLPVDDLVLLDIDPERLSIVGALAERMMRRAGWSGNLTLTADRRRSARRRRLRDRAAACGRPGRPVPGRDDPAAVREHRAGDDGGGRVREGAPHGSDGAGAGRGDGTSRRARGVVRGLHQPDGAGDPGAAGRGSPGDGPLQRGDRVPTTVRDALRRRTGARAARTRRAQPPDLGAQGAGGRRRPVCPRSSTRGSTRSPTRPTCPRTSSGRSARSRRTTCTTTTSRSASWSVSEPGGPVPKRSWRSRPGCSSCTRTRRWIRSPSCSRSGAARSTATRRRRSSRRSTPERTTSRS